MGWKEPPAASLAALPVLHLHFLTADKPKTPWTTAYPSGPVIKWVQKRGHLAGFQGRSIEANYLDRGANRDVFLLDQGKAACLPLDRNMLCVFFS